MKNVLIRIKWPFVIILILALILGVRHFRADPASKVIVPQSQTVQVQKIAKEKKAQLLELSGSIEAQNSAVISSKFGGKIKQIPVDNGTKVETGQVLLFMEDGQQQSGVLAARSALDKAKANLDNLQKTYEQTSELFKAGFASQSDLDKAKLGLDAAAADVGSAGAGLANAEEVLRDTRIVSPLNGLVANRMVKEGQVVGAGTPLMTVHDISSVNVIVKISQEYIAKVKPGLPAAVYVDAYPEQKFEGEVKIINPAADVATRSFEVKIAVSNPDSLLKPGMYAKAELSLGAAQDALSVPQTAVSGKEGLYYVFLADGNRAKRQPIQIGEILGKNIEVKSGLEEGQELIVTNVNKLKDGDPIQIADQP